MMPVDDELLSAASSLDDETELPITNPDFEDNMMKESTNGG